MRVSFFFLLSLIILSGCVAPKVERRVDPTEISRTILTFSEKLKYEQQLVLEDSCIFYDQNINRIRLDFSTMRIVNLCEARELLVDVVEEFLDRVNYHPEIAAQLRRPPITAKNLEIYIRFESFYNKYVDLKRIALVSLRNGISHFLAATGFDCETECWHRRSEYYYQSRQFAEFRREGEALYKPKPQKSLETTLEEERVTEF